MTKEKKRQDRAYACIFILGIMAVLGLLPLLIVAPEITKIPECHDLTVYQCAKISSSPWAGIYKDDTLCILLIIFTFIAAEIYFWILRAYKPRPFDFAESWLAKGLSVLVGVGIGVLACTIIYVSRFIPSITTDIYTWFSQYWGFLIIPVIIIAWVTINHILQKCIWRG